MRDPKVCIYIYRFPHPRHERERYRNLTQNQAGIHAWTPQKKPPLRVSNASYSTPHSHPRTTRSRHHRSILFRALVDQFHNPLSAATSICFQFLNTTTSSGASLVNGCATSDASGRIDPSGGGGGGGGGGSIVVIVVLPVAEFFRGGGG